MCEAAVLEVTESELSESEEISKTGGARPNRGIQGKRPISYVQWVMKPRPSNLSLGNHQTFGILRLTVHV